MTAAVTREQRHTRAHRCIVCDGADGDPRGKQRRCSGFTSSDGKYIHCSREEFAGGIAINNAMLFAHVANGACNCGKTHGHGAVVPFDAIEAAYDYRDENKQLLFQVVRKPGKKFLQRRPDGAGGWLWKVGNVRRVLYRLPALLAAPPEKPVYVVEGEKDVDTLWRLGHIATCNPGGAGKWSFVADHAREVLRGRAVIVVADTDEVGQKHAAEVLESLRTVARSVELRQPPPPSKDVTDFVLSGASLEALVPVTTDAPTPRVLRRPGDRVRALAELGPVKRLETGIATLDDACRGGLPTRRLVVLGGAPGAGKTTLATNWGWRWAKRGVAVGMLAVDEGPEGTFSRIAQLEGMSADRLEERDRSMLSRLAETLDASGLILADAEDVEGTVEALAERVATAAGGKLGVLIVDSIQTVRAVGTDSVDSPRERVDAVVRALKSARDRFGLLVIATCELARGAYRSRSIAETINDLAAFKESGSVEYAAQTALVLRSVPEESSLVDVTVPKNRAYQREPFRLHLDHATTLFTETELPELPPMSGRRSSASNDSMRRAVVDSVRSAGRHSARDIVRGIRDAGVRVSNREIHDVINCMLAEGCLARPEARGPFAIVVPPENGGRHVDS